MLFRSDKGFHFRACDTSRTIGDSAIFEGVLEITYSQDANTDVDAKYIKIRGSAQGCAFWGSQKPTFNIYTPFSLKTAIFGAQFRRYFRNYYCQKTSQFKTVCKDDSGYSTQLKQQKSKRWYYLAAHRHIVNVAMCCRRSRRPRFPVHGFKFWQFVST